MIRKINPRLNLVGMTSIFIRKNLGLVREITVIPLYTYCIGGRMGIIGGVPPLVDLNFYVLLRGGVIGCYRCLYQNGLKDIRHDVGWRVRRKLGELIMPRKLHTFTKDEQAKGGRAKNLVKKLARRKYCEPKCPIYPCYVQPLAMENLEGKYSYQKYWCAYHEMDPRMKQRYLRLHLGGSEGLRDEMRDTLLEMKDSVDPIDRVGQLGKYFDRLEKLDARISPPAKSQVDVHVDGEVHHEHHITIDRIVEEFQIVEGKSKVLPEEGEDDEET